MNYHSLLHNRYNSWHELESQIEIIALAPEKGEVFEQFVFAYLMLNKDYYQIDKLYRAKDIPVEIREKLKLETTDYGVDGVFVLTNGTIAAYQAKFRSARATATVRELATFWSEASRADHQYVIANATELPKQAGKHSYSILAERFDELDDQFFEALHQYVEKEVVPEIAAATPDAHQVRMIENTLKGFESADRGKLIAACGVGKTLTSLWIVEAMDASSTLILVPSLALIKQTLESWSKQKNKSFAYLCVCSDQSVVEAKENDYGEYDISEIDFPVTTDPAVIEKFLTADINKSKYIFSTYNSAQTIADAIPSNFKFDLIIFDEAHRTAGQKDSGMYQVGLYDSGIAAKKRLFMTATERLIQPWIITKAAELDRVVYSMDDESIYGKTFDRYTFGEAIQDGVISDYKIVLTAVGAEEVESLIKNNRLIIAEGDEKERHLSAQNIYKQVVLQKAMQSFGIKKTITFHSSVKRAKAFISGGSAEAYGLKDLYGLTWPETAGQDLYFDWVDGSLPAGLRKQKLKDFEQSDIGIVSNAKCLTEGVDIPIIDSVYFVDPKTSLVDIVQACGRALRKNRGSAEQKVAYFIVPIIINEPGDSFDTGKFETLFNLIQALRGQDERMADWIDRINLGHVRGNGGGLGTGDDPIVINFPQEFDLSEFSSNIQVQIFEGVKGPRDAETRQAFSQRRSNFRKVFKAIGDYSYDTYMNTLVNPTLEKFNNLDQQIAAADLKINNNNISHSQRLGVISKNEASNFELTQIGKKLVSGEVQPEDVFKQALLNYNCVDKASGKADQAIDESADQDVPLFPYRAALQILARVDSINKVEFLYGIYSLTDSSTESIEESVGRIAKIRQKYVNILNVNDANKTIVMRELNQLFGENFSEADLWGSTTANNKFLYLKNHLALFDGITASAINIQLAESAKQDVIDLLA